MSRSRLHVPVGDLSSASILIASGNAFTAAYLQRVLRRVGVEHVLRAVNGPEALQKILGGHCSILLLDIELPVISGLELLEVLRADPKLANLPVVVATAVNQTDVVRRAIELGVRGYLLKPYDEELVRERLTEVIAESAARNGRRGPGKLSFLSATSDAGFRETLREALGGADEFHGAESVAEWLAAATTERPDCLLIEPKFFGGRVKFFGNAAFRDREADPPTVIVIDDGSGDEADLPRIDGLIRKQFVPEKLRAAVHGLIEQPARRVDLVEAAAGELGSAIKQTLGMLTGVEPEILASRGALPGRWTRVELRRVEDEASWSVVFGTDDEGARRLTAEISGLDAEDIPEECLDEGPREIAGVAAGRIKRLAADWGYRLELGTPHSTDRPPVEGTGPCFGFRWNGLEGFVAAFRQTHGPTLHV